MDGLIRAEGLSRSYRVPKHGGGLLKRLFSAEFETIFAVRDITFSIEEGEAVGFIGPGGAGKSTIIKMLLGILTPSAGSVTVMGNDPVRNRRDNAYKIGVVFGHRSQLWWDLRVCDSFKLLKRIYKIPDGVYRENLEYAKEFLDMGSLWDEPVRELRPGLRMLAETAAAIVHGPKLLILDEPVLETDIPAKRRICEFTKTLNRERGTTIIMAAQEMKVVMEVCRRVMLMDLGSIVLDSSVAAFKQRFGGKHSIRVDLDAPLPEFTLDGVLSSHRFGGLTWDFKINQDRITIGRLIDEISKRAEIARVTVEEGRIEDIIHEIYIDGLNDELYEDD
ncbi:MAG: ATP-binding cassette domain-containing protein [Synergistaceae bacterium]|nr:ATP-binding cassette domain-containing protein [Synergistaceae bacterium]